MSWPYSRHLNVRLTAIWQTCNRRDSNGPESPRLIGLALGVAMKMGIHIVESTSHLSAFDKELRRRLWWQIRTLDVRIAEDYHVDPIIIEQACDTALPTNTDDISLHPDMTARPPAQQGRTEMLYSIVRFRTSHLALRMVFSTAICHKNGYEVLSMADKCQRIDRFWDNLENGLLSHCDTNIPLDFVTVTSTRLVIVKLKLAVCKPRVGERLDMGMRASYRATCEEVLRHALVLRQYEKGQQWLWLFQTYLEWDALAYLLLDICLTPGAATTSTWAAIENVYDHWKESPDVRRDQRWENIEELRQEALTRRQQAPGAANSQQHQPSTCGSHEQTDNTYEPASTNSWTPDNVDSAMQLSGDGTTSEWDDEALLEQYWQIAGWSE